MSNQRPRILAIDDTLANLRTLGTALASSFDLQVATSGAMGLSLALKSPPDLILLDVMMPEMDGYETYRRLMAEPHLQKIPVIFLTALNSVEDEILGLSLGAADYITKPINVELARQRIGNILDRERFRKDVERQRDLLAAEIVERKQAEMALQESEARFRAIIEASPIPYALNDDQQNIICVNASFIKTFGYTRDDIPLLSDWWPKAYPDDEYRQEIVATWQAHMEKAIREGQPFEPVEAVILCKNGEKRTALVAAEPLNGSLRGQHVVSFFDITARKQAEEALRLAATVFSHAREGILITNADGIILDVNEMFSEINGYEREEMVGKNPNLLSSGRHEESFYAAMWQKLIEDGNWVGEVSNRRKNGEIYPGMLTISAVRDAHGKTQSYVALLSDISALKDHERQLEQMAHYDALTKLPNRVLLADRLQQAMSQADRHKRGFAVLYLDLDGFKAINDQYGHDVGDKLLIALVAIMQQTLRETDTLARIGGDEFVALLLDLADKNDSFIFLERLIRTISQPLHIGELVVQVSASLGMTFYPQAGTVGADQLLRQADQAMYQAKQAGKGCYRVYSDLSTIRLAWQSDYNCGEPAIDMEHQELVRLANILIDVATKYGGKHEQFNNAFDALLAHVAKHFAHEEEILRSHRYEGTSEHAEQHRLLLKHASKLRWLSGKSDIAVGPLVEFLVSEVVKGHLVAWDSKFYDLFVDLERPN